MKRSPRIRQPEIAVAIPCLNEASTIGRVVRAFRRELPHAMIYVVDNDSTDRTVEEARRAGARVILEKRRGKGYVVQTIFQLVDADVVVLVDGDDTYPARSVHRLIAAVAKEEADMVVGSRTMAGPTKGIRPLNWLGNLFYRRVINLIFGTRLTDILSGYRVFSRRLVKSLPIFVTGFEVEAELTIKSLERGYRITEIPIAIAPRPPGSTSKIRVVQDGFRILSTILALFRDYKPLSFFGGSGAILFFVGSLLGLASYLQFLATDVWSTALLVTSGLFTVTGILFLVIGIILHTINRRFQELEHYLRLILPR